MAIVNLNTEQFHQHAQGAQPALVEFWAPWCVYCRRIAPALEQVAQQYHDRLLFGQVNIDDEPQLAELEHIRLVPTFILYRNGQAIGSITAPDSKAALEAFLLEHLGL